MSMIQVSGVDALTERFGSPASHCSAAPRMPRASIIQNRISAPMSGVTIIGRSEKKIVGPRRRAAGC
jgi:hypothetical protein